MLETIAPLAYGPIGDASVAVFWVVLWTVILGSSLYAAVIFLPPWVDMSDVQDSSAHH